MKTVDLGLLSAGVGAVISLGGVVLVLLDVPLPDRTPHGREAEMPFEAMEAEVPAMDRNAGIVNRASQSSATCDDLAALYEIFPPDLAAQLVADFAPSSQCPAALTPSSSMTSTPSSPSP